LWGGGYHFQKAADMVFQPKYGRSLYTVALVDAVIINPAVFYIKIKKSKQDKVFLVTVSTIFKKLFFLPVLVLYFLKLSATQGMLSYEKAWRHVVCLK
jgi:hypothetical protein